MHKIMFQGQKITDIWSGVWLYPVNCFVKVSFIFDNFILRFTFNMPIDIFCPLQFSLQILMTQFYIPSSIFYFKILAF